MELIFSEKQQIAFDKYVAGHNIFITGPGGGTLNLYDVTETSNFSKIYTGCSQLAVVDRNNNGSIFMLSHFSFRSV